MLYRIIQEEHPEPHSVQLLLNGLSEYAKEKKELQPILFFHFFIKDENDKIQGGCCGDNLYGCLYISTLWITSALRGKGYGTQLMLAAEKWGKEKNCSFAAVNTMDWEALGFYQKLGFRIEFERHGFQKNSIFYFLRKDFV